MDNQDFENIKDGANGGEQASDFVNLSFLWADEDESPAETKAEETNVFDKIFGDEPSEENYPNKDIGAKLLGKADERTDARVENEKKKKPKKTKSSKKGKKKLRKSRIAYLIFVFILILAIVFGLIWVWKQCKEYQANSAATIIADAEAKLEEQTGLDLEYSLIPTISENDEYVYVMKADKKPVAKVTLTKTKSGIMGLALFEQKSVESMITYKIIIPSDSTLSVEGQTIDYSDTFSDYSFAALDTLKSSGFGLLDFKETEVNWVYDVSQISVSRKDRQLPLVELAEDTYLAVPYYSGKVCETLRERAAELSNKYALFMSYDYSYWDLDPYIISGSPLESSLAGMDMSWFGSHYDTSVSDLKVSDPMIVGDRFALVNTSFNYNVYRWDGTDISPIELSLVLYLCDDGYWKIADLATYIDTDLELKDQHPWINPNSMPNGQYPYYIKVNRSLNCVTVYTQDSDGAYTVPVKAMVCSTGKEGNETPVYDYGMEWRADWCYMVDGSYGRYAINLRYDGYMFHTICYYSQGKDQMMVDEYNLLGNYASLGCVRLQTIDALWLYNNCVDGTRVSVYEDPASPGPLGKPSKEVENISAEMDNGWDPTDPSPKNPWRTILN